MLAAYSFCSTLELKSNFTVPGILLHICKQSHIKKQKSGFTIKCSLRLKFKRSDKIVSNNRD